MVLPSEQVAVALPACARVKTSQADASTRLTHMTAAKTYLFMEVNSFGTMLKRPCG
jgi:hypothetical protein